MKKTTQIFLLAAVMTTGLTSRIAGAEQPARYIVILDQRSAPAPDLGPLGGTIEFRKDEELIITLPPESIATLKAQPGVKYIQRVGPGAGAVTPVGAPSEPTPEGSRMPRLSPSAAALKPQPTGANPWDSGAYTYDGAGNITRIGSQSFVYDQAQRLVQAKLDGVLDTYGYDAFGNVTSKTAGGQAQSIPSPVASTNRSGGVSYDEVGNVLSDGAWTFTYDAAGQPLTESYAGANFTRYVYTAGNERIGVLKSGWWFWSLRDETGKVLRQYRSVDGNPSVPLLWMEDFVWRDGLLLGGERPLEMGGRRHFHLDHLGSVRLITGDSGQAVSLHDYYPFGDEKTMVVQETAHGFDREEPMKFTGHERDFAGGQGAEDSHYIDYMHARFYSPTLGRFLTPDPLPGNPLFPQSWNRYTYVIDSPMNLIDPDGLKECQPGQKLEPGDTCNGTVVDGWCTGETITVEGKPIDEDLSFWQQLTAPPVFLNKAWQDHFKTEPKKPSTFTQEQCRELETLVKREQNVGTERAAGQSGNTFGDRTISGFNVDGGTRGNAQLPGGKQFDMDWFTEIRSYSRYGALEAYVVGKATWHAIKGTKGWWFQDPGEIAAVYYATKGATYLQIYKEACQ